MSDNQSCDLCGLDCGARPFVLRTAERNLRFCCEACRGIYQMLHEINELPARSACNDDRTA
jgi:hypothetical protein